MNFPWLTVMCVLPLVGAVVTALAPRTGELAKQVGLLFAGLTLAAGIVVTVLFDVGERGLQLTETHDWISAIGVHYALGVDGLGLLLMLLTAFLVPVVMVAAWHDGDEVTVPAGRAVRAAAGRTGVGSTADVTRSGSTAVGAQGSRSGSQVFFAWALALEGLSLAVFAATDVFLFYMVFEATLIPAYFLIGGFGKPGRAGRAALKFLMFQLAGGLILLGSVIGLYVVSAQEGTPSYLLTDLMGLDIGTSAGRWLFAGFMIAFVVKAPLFPLHTWLADTTEAATPATSVLLVCVLDKIGTFGMLRFCLGLFPEASRWATPLVIVLALISIVYGALIAIGQDDILRLIGLTSLSHFGFITLGIFAFNSQGSSGAILYMVNHGVGTAALFLIAGYLIRRRGTTLISQMGGLEKVAPIAAGLLLVAGLATLGLPGLSQFVSEILVLIAAFDYRWYVGAVAVTGIVLAAIYVLWMYQRTMTGPTPPELESGTDGGPGAMTDLGIREIAAVAPLMVALVLFGFLPQPLLDVANPTSYSLLERVGVGDDPPVVPLTATDEPED